MQTIELYSNLTSLLSDARSTKNSSKLWKVSSIVLMKAFRAISQALLDMDVDQLKLVNESLHSNTQKHLITLVVQQYLRLPQNSKEECRIKELISIFEMVEQPVTIFRGITEVFRDFLNNRVQKKHLLDNFEPAIDLLDYYIEAKSDSNESECYFLMDQNFQKKQVFKVDVDSSILQGSNFAVLVKFKQLENLESEIITLKFGVQNFENISQKNEEINLKISLKSNTIQVLFQETRTGTIKINQILNQNIDIYLMMDPNHKLQIGVLGSSQTVNLDLQPLLPKQDNLYLKIEELTFLDSFSGRVYHILLTNLDKMIANVLGNVNNHEQFLKKEGNGSLSAQELKLLLDNLSINYSILSRDVVEGGDLFNREEIQSLPYLGKNYKEVNLSFSPGLTVLLPIFNLLSKKIRLIYVPYLTSSLKNYARKIQSRKLPGNYWLYLE